MRQALLPAELMIHKIGRGGRTRTHDGLQASALEAVALAAMRLPYKGLVIYYEKTLPKIIKICQKIFYLGDYKRDLVLGLPSNI